MARVLAIATAVLLAGCGAPGLSGRGAMVQDPGGPISLSRQDWGSSMCSTLGCTGRCGSAACGFAVTCTGLPAASSREKE